MTATLFGEVKSATFANADQVRQIIFFVTVNVSPESLKAIRIKQQKPCLKNTITLFLFFFEDLLPFVVVIKFKMLSSVPVQNLSTGNTTYDCVVLMFV